MAKDLICMVIGAKSDLVEERQVPTDEGAFSKERIPPPALLFNLCLQDESLQRETIGSSMRRRRRRARMLRIP